MTTDDMCVNDSQTAGKTSVERRAAPRGDAGSQPLRLVLRGADGNEVDVFARNVSETGLMFICPQALDQGQRVTIHTTGPAESRRVLAGEVVRCDPLSGSFHEIAVRFDQPVNPECLMDWQNLRG
jgi:hypothetical protein